MRTIFINKIFFITLILFSLTITSCITNQETVQSDNKKVERTSNTDYSLTSTTDVKELVTDPITMDRCDKTSAVFYQGNFFCSKDSLAKFKEENK